MVMISDSDCDKRLGCPTTEQMSTVGLDGEAGCLQADGTEPVLAWRSTWLCWFLKRWEEEEKNRNLFLVSKCATGTAKRLKLNVLKDKWKNRDFPMIDACLNQTNTVFISDWLVAILLTQMKTVIIIVIVSIAPCASLWYKHSLPTSYQSLKKWLIDYWGRQQQQQQQNVKFYSVSGLISWFSPCGSSCRSTLTGWWNMAVMWMEQGDRMEAPRDGGPACNQTASG